MIEELVKRKKQAMIEELVKRKYDSDPVKAWKNSQDVDDDQEEEPEGDEGNQEVIASKKSKGPDFDYLMSMPMWNLTQEKIDELCKKRDEKRQELNELKATSKEELWRRDLREFLAKLDEVEEGERMDDEEGGSGGGETKPIGKATKGKSKGKGGAVVKADTLPSKHAVRVEPKVSDDLKAKVVQAAALKVRKQTKKEEGKVKDVERDEFDEMADDKQNVRQRINSGDNAKVKKQRDESGSAKTKQTKLNFKPVDKKPKRNPWSDVDSDEDIADVDSPDAAPPRSKPSRMGSKQNKKYAEDSGEEEQELQPVEKKEYQEYKGSGAERLDSEDDSKAGGFGANFDVSSSEEEITRKVVKKAAPRKLGPPQNKEDSSKGKVSSSKPVSKKPTAVKKKFMESSDEENRPPKKSKARQVVDSGDDSDFEVESIAAKPRTTGGRKKAAVNYGQGDSSGSDF